MVFINVNLYQNIAPTINYMYIYSLITDVRNGPINNVYLYKKQRCRKLSNCKVIHISFALNPV